jgi:hypothetical protein
MGIRSGKTIFEVVCDKCHDYRVNVKAHDEQTAIAKLYKKGWSFTIEGVMLDEHYVLTCPACREKSKEL